MGNNAQGRARMKKTRVAQKAVAHKTQIFSTFKTRVASHQLSIGAEWRKRLIVPTLIIKRVNTPEGIGLLIFVEQIRKNTSALPAKRADF
jgi:hypothetical protein